MRRADLPRPGPAPSPRSARRGKLVQLDERLDLLAGAPERGARRLDRLAEGGRDGARAALDGLAPVTELTLDPGTGLAHLALTAALELRQVAGHGTLGGADGAVALAQVLGDLDDVVAGLEHGTRVGEDDALGVRAGLGGGRLRGPLVGLGGLRRGAAGGLRGRARGLRSVGARARRRAGAAGRLRGGRAAV